MFFFFSWRAQSFPYLQLAGKFILFRNVLIRRPTFAKDCNGSKGACFAMRTTVYFAHADVSKLKHAVAVSCVPGCAGQKDQQL
jgi:hypothetical protein